MALRGRVRPCPGPWLTQLQPGRRRGRVCAQRRQYPRRVEVRVSGRAIRVVSTPLMISPVSVSAPSESVPLVGPPPRTDEHDDSSEQARWPRERACGPHARASLGLRAVGVPRPAGPGPRLERTACTAPGTRQVSNPAPQGTETASHGVVTGAHHDSDVAHLGRLKSTVEAPRAPGRVHDPALP